jgi:plasmid stabilization system protein ParE
MSYKIVVTPKAVQQIDDAIDYYKNKVSVKIARLFIEDYKITFKEILTTRYFKLFFEEFRGKPMKKFPFIIFYTVDETEKVIIIKAVFHTAQHPDKYPK